MQRLHLGTTLAILVPMDDFKCPRCSGGPASVNVIGNSIYCTCGWSGPLNLRQVERRRRMIKIASRGFLAVLLVILATLGVQYLRWGRFTGNYVLTHVKSVIGADEAADWQNLGLACERLGRFDCMESSFERVLQLLPEQSFALQSIGIAQVNQRKFKSAASSFESLFDQGTNTAESMYYYGKAMEGLGDLEAGKTWYYRTLMIYPNLLDVTDDLVDLLVREGSYMEALSVLGNLATLIPRTQAYFQGRILAISDLVEKGAASTEAKSFRMAAIHDHHFLPIRVGQGAAAAMFMVDTGATKLTFSPDFMRKNQVTDYKSIGRVKVRLADESEHYAEIILLPKITIGPWVLENIEAAVCESCSPLAGKSVLKHFRTSTRLSKGVEYLELSR